MTDKEKIIAEIERLKKELYKQRDFRIDGSPIPVYDTNAIDGMLKVLDEVKGFINSLPDEQPSGDLEEEIKRKYKNNIGLMMPIESFRKLILHFTQWQKEQIMKGFCYETKVYRDEEGDGIDTPIESWLNLENNEITNLPNIGLKDGDKVKVIVIKEDEQ